MCFCKFHHFSLDCLTLIDWYWLPNIYSFLRLLQTSFFCVFKWWSGDILNRSCCCWTSCLYELSIDDLGDYFLGWSSLEGEWFSWTDLTGVRVSNRLAPPKNPESQFSSKIYQFPAEYLSVTNLWDIFTSPWHFFFCKITICLEFCFWVHLFNQIKGKKTCDL